MLSASTNAVYSTEINTKAEQVPICNDAQETNLDCADKADAENTTEETVMTKQDNSATPALTRREVVDGLQTYHSVPTINLNRYRIPMSSADLPLPVYNHRETHMQEYGQQEASMAETWGNPGNSVFDHYGNESRCTNRGRTTYSDEQIHELERMFSRNPYPTPQSRQGLAQTINVPEGKVKIWFQNRRARAKKQRPNGGLSFGLRSSQRFGSSSQKQSKGMMRKPLFLEPPNELSLETEKLNSLPSSRSLDYDALSSECSMTGLGSDGSSAQSALSLSCLSIRNLDLTGSSSSSSLKDLSGTTDPAYSLNQGSSLASVGSNRKPCFPQIWDSKISNYDRCKNSNEDYFQVSYPSKFPVIHKSLERSMAAYSIEECNSTSSNQMTSFGVNRPRGDFPTFNTTNARPASSNQGNNFARNDCSYQLNTAVPVRRRINSRFNNEEFNKSQLPSNCGYYGYNEAKKYFYSKMPPYSTYIPSSASRCPFQSPPPLRRYSFPFNTLLEHARNMEESNNNMKKTTSDLLPYSNCSYSNQPVTNASDYAADVDTNFFTPHPIRSCQSLAGCVDSQCLLQSGAKKTFFPGTDSSFPEVCSQSQDINLHGIDHRHASSFATTEVERNMCESSQKIPIVSETSTVKLDTSYCDVAKTDSLRSISFSCFIPRSCSQEKNTDAANVWQDAAAASESQDHISCQVADDITDCSRSKIHCSPHKVDATVSSLWAETNLGGVGTALPQVG